jgi:hypothetical protein
MWLQIVFVSLSVGFGSLRCGSGMGIGYDLVFQCCLVGSLLGLRSGF